MLQWSVLICHGAARSQEGSSEPTFVVDVNEAWCYAPIVVHAHIGLHWIVVNCHNWFYYRKSFHGFSSSTHHAVKTVMRWRGHDDALLRWTNVGSSCVCTLVLKSFMLSWSKTSHVVMNKHWLTCLAGLMTSNSDLSSHSLSSTSTKLFKILRYDFCHFFGYSCQVAAVAHWYLSQSLAALATASGHVVIFLSPQVGIAVC